MKALDPTSLVFIDESGFDTKMARLRGRSERGKPCFGAVPQGHWGNNTFIAGLRHDTIVAPMLIPGAMNGKTFAVWVEQALAPTLSKGDIVICDNLNVHKNAAANAAIKARGAELRFLPAYSPDFNPIEMLFAKIKALVRSAAARCFDTLCGAMAEHSMPYRAPNAQIICATQGMPNLIGKHSSGTNSTFEPRIAVGFALNWQSQKFH